MGVKPHLLLSLGGHSKQGGDELTCPRMSPFFHTTHLPFPEHVHHLVALQGSPCRLKRKEAHSRFDQTFDKAMILFDNVV